MRTLLQKSIHDSVITVEGDLNKSLWEASLSGDDAKVGKLMLAGADVHSKEPPGNNNGLILSALKGHDKIVKMFLESGVGVNTRGRLKMSALMWAAQEGHLSTARLLLDNNADPDLQREDGSTSMMRAAALNFADLVSELLSRGAREDLTNKWGRTALETAENASSYDTIKMFTAWKDPESRNDMLLEAASEGKSRLVKGLLISGASLEHRNAGDDQALHIAARKGHNAVISVLLDHGVDINSRGSSDHTPLIKAAYTGHHKTVRLLLEAGADIDLKKRDGWTALMVATIQNDLTIASELVTWGADTTILTNKGNTPLKSALKNNYHDIALVLDNTEISEDDPNIKKVLITATENGHVTVLSNLLKRGARLFDAQENMIIKNKVGDTLFQVATRYPQVKKQEYEVILKDFKRTGVKPKKTLDSIIEASSDKSNRMAKLFLSQKLDSHDTSSISQWVSDIIAHTKADHFNKEIFGEQGKFFKNTASKGENKETLLGSVLNLGLLKEREEILEIIKKVEENNSSDSEDTQFRMKQEVKSAVVSSVGLRDCLKSIGQQFSWSKEKMIFMITMSAFIYIFMGTALYSLDVYTDVKFSWEMFAQSSRNFTKDREICKREFETEFDKAVSECKTFFHANKCMDSLRNIEKLGQHCFENEQRFRENPIEWKHAGVISAVHYVLPFLMSFLIWIIYEFGRSCGAGAVEIFNLPLPPLTKFYRFLCDIKLFKIFADRNVKTEKEFEVDKKRIHEEISSHENIVNLSLIIEASVESSFQFFFQTTFQLPSIILAFTDPSAGFEWSDLFNWQFFSIAMSFFSFSNAFLKIRLIQMEKCKIFKVFSF